MAQVALMVLMAACGRFVPTERDAEDLPLSEAFTLYGPTAPAPEQWWHSLNSEELNGLMASALDGNFTLQQAVARIRQAGAVAKQAGAFRYPDLGYETSSSVTRTHTDTGESTPKLDIATQKLGALGTLLSTNGMATSTGSSSTTSTGSPLLDAALAPMYGTQSIAQNVRSSAQAAQSKLNALDTLLSSPPSSEMTFTTESYLVGLTTNYELDLWGRLRASQQSAQLNLEASREDVYSAMQTVAGQVVLTWLDILMDRNVLEVVRKQVEKNETNLELIELRWRNGLATALDVFQQRQAVAQAGAAIPQLEAQLATLEHQLSVLLGKPPRTDLGLAADAFPEPGPLPDQGLPADLLAQRPDVRAAGLWLQSADWQVSAARADRLPSIRLSASASYGANELDLLFDNWMARLAGSITGPIFDAGSRKAEVERTRAVVDERLAAYKQTVATAVQEVEDALVLEAKQGEYIDALKRQLEAAQSTYDVSLARYLKGLNDYLPVLSALTSVQTLERALVQAEHDLLVYRVQIHLALGGAWMRQELGDPEA
jgi:outer membrane protein, multidrug efflux system